ncbi:MAG: MarC family protein [Gemmatimonadota bacterium]|nr:MarC family protein [Gemmatimonadota bacterium]MDE3127740.1 MarC family protein [Gemmatimonadota bacterium]
MQELLQFGLITLTSVLFIVDPIAAVPSYLVITQNESPAERKRTALRACVAMALLLVVFAAAGRFIFQAFGITLPAFRIAGGLILWLVALDMVRAQRSTHEGKEELSEGQVKEDVAVTPLAIPVLAGPGAISTVMVLAGEIRSVVHGLVVYGAIVVTAIVSYVTLRLGERLIEILGQTGIRVMTRIMGLLLAAVATQFIVTGIRDSFMR